MITFQPPAQAIIVPGATKTDKSAPFGLTLLQADGTPYTPLTAKAAHQANSVAADTAAMVVDFNALLAKLQAAGLMA